MPITSFLIYVHTDNLRIFDTIEESLAVVFYLSIYFITFKNSASDTVEYIYCVYVYNFIIIGATKVCHRSSFYNVSR